MKTFTAIFVLLCASVCWAADPPQPAQPFSTRVSLSFLVPTNSTLSNGLNVDSSGNLLINAGGGTAHLLSNGLSLDNSGNLLVNCAVGCSGGASIPLGTATQFPVMNAGATAYVPVSMSADCSMTSAGAVTCTKSNGSAFGTGAFATISLYETIAAAQAAFAGLGSCTNQFVTATNANAAPTCTSVTPTLAGLSNVTNDAQTKAAIVPNTAPSAGQFPIGNAGGTAYAPGSMSQDCTMTSAGVVTCLKTNNASFGSAAVKNIVGTDAGVATAATISTTALNEICSTANGGISTTNCPVNVGSGTEVGAANALKVTVQGFPASIADNLCVVTTVASGHGSTGATTLEVIPFTGATTYGAITVNKRTTAGYAAIGAAGDIVALDKYQFCYDSTASVWVAMTTSSTVYAGGLLGAADFLYGNSNNQIAAATSITMDGTHAFFAKINNETLAGFGVPFVRGVTSQKSETTTADANVLTVTPASTVGTYRACVTISVSAATSGIISWTLSWHDSNAATQANIAQDLFQIQPAATAAPAQSFTTSAASNYYGCSYFDVDSSGSSIIVKWVGGGTTTAKMSAVIERLQ